MNKWFNSLLEILVYVKIYFVLIMIYFEIVVIGIRFDVKICFRRCLRWKCCNNGHINIYELVGSLCLSITVCIIICILFMVGVMFRRMCVYSMCQNNGCNLMRKLVGRFCLAISECIITICILLIVGVGFLKSKKILSMLKQLLYDYSFDLIIVFVLGKFGIWCRTLYLIHVSHRLPWVSKRKQATKSNCFSYKKNKLWSIKWRKERKKSMNVYRSFCLICKKKCASNDKE